jgi:hypothetical protein
MPTAFPPKVRAIAYWIWIISGLLLGSVQVFFFVSNLLTPWWFPGVWAVYGFLGAGFGFTAASHVVINPPPADLAQPEADTPIYRDPDERTGLVP